MKKLKSLKFKMPIVIMIFVTVLTILLVSIIISIGSKGIEKTARTGFGTTTYIYSRLINVWLNELTTVGKQIVRGNTQLATALENPTPENNRNATDRLSSLSKGNDSIMSLYLINMEGKVVLDSENNLIVGNNNKDWLKTIAWTKLKNSSYDYSIFETDEPSPIDKKTRVIQILIGIKNPATQKPVGAMVIMVDWDKFVAKEIKTLKVGRSGHAFVIDKDGWVIGDPIDSHVRSEALQKADFIQHAIKNQSGFMEFTSPFNGRKSIVSFDTDTTTDWTIAISIEKSELYADVHTMITVGIIGTIVALIITSIVIVLFSRTITTPIRIITEDLTKLSNGDLTWKVEQKMLKRTDEFALIAKAKLNILETLGNTIKSVVEIADQVSVSSSEVAEGNSDLAHRTENQAASLEETASSMEEIASTIKSSADYSVHGNKMMLESKSGIENAGTIISATTYNIEAVFEASSKITAITKIIESIAFQTNILALNAAVEAARAGEQGRGFAVVASEVRNLAQTTQTSVKDITTLIEDANNKIKLATETARQSQEIFADLQKHIDETAKIMKDINETAMEQLSGIEQVNKAVSEMDITTQKNAALVEESTAASETLHAQAEELVQAMNFFKINR